MNTVVYHKFTQHKDLKRELLATGDMELIEVSREICCVEISQHGLMHLYRTRTKTRSGAVGQMEREEMNSGKPSNVSALSCLRRSGDNLLN